MVIFLATQEDPNGAFSLPCPGPRRGVHTDFLGMRTCARMHVLGL